MSRVRHILLGHAPPKTSWFQHVGAWASSAAIPVEFVRCLSLSELEQRWAAAEHCTAVIVDAEVTATDAWVRGAVASGIPVIVVDDDHGRWAKMPLAAALHADFTPRQLVDALDAVAGGLDAYEVEASPDAPVGHRRGSLVMVTGAGGTGTSTVAIALAQGLSRGKNGQDRPRVLLADLCRRADQAMLHDARALVPGIPELVEDCRSATPRHGDVRALTFDVPARGYRLLLGMRRSRQWVGMRPDAVDRAVGVLQSLAELVVADVEPELAGEDETGSVDVEDRHRLARGVTRRADVIVVVAAPTMKGVCSAVDVAGDIVGHGAHPERIIMAVNRSPRRLKDRREIAASLTSLLAAALEIDRSRLRAPVHLPAAGVESAHRDGSPLPARLCQRIVEAVLTQIRAADGMPREPNVAAGQPDPAPIVRIS